MMLTTGMTEIGLAADMRTVLNAIDVFDGKIQAQTSAAIVLGTASNENS